MELIHTGKAFHCAKFVIKDEGVELFNEWYNKGDENWRGHLEWCAQAFHNTAAYRFQAVDSPPGTKTFYAVYVWDSPEEKEAGMKTPEMPELLRHGEMLKPYVVDQVDIDFNELLTCLPDPGTV